MADARRWCPMCRLHHVGTCATGSYFTGAEIASGQINPTLLLQLEADAGAVPGCTTECAKARAALAEHEQWKETLLDEARGRNPEGATALDFYAVWLDQERAANASLRADAEAVRAVEEWLKTHGFDRVLVDSFGNLGMFSIGEGKIAAATNTADLGRALMARRQEEGQTDNG